METIAALVIAYNEEKTIRDCLKSIDWVDEIIVVDSLSKDKTVEISREYTDKVFINEFVDFASQRNFGIDKMRSDWVLILDADERITPDLRNEILTEIKDSQAEAYLIPRKNFFVQKWVKCCGWYPDYTLRLFKKKNNRYSGKVHEDIKIKGQVEKLNNPLLHYTYRNLEHFMSKMNQYTSLSAEGMYQQGKKKSFGYALLRLILEFIKKYILQKGFLYGTRGLLLSLVFSFYTFMKYVKLWELYQTEPKNNN